MTNRAIVLHPDDNVATAVADLAEGEEVRVGSQVLKVVEPVPFGHKVALRDIGSRMPITKYGESIGLALGDIAAGTCVHTQNVESQRGRGDLTAKQG